MARLRDFRATSSLATRSISYFICPMFNSTERTFLIFLNFSLRTSLGKGQRVLGLNNPALIPCSRVFLDKRKAYANPYPRITISIASKPLFEQLSEILAKHFSLYCLEKKNRKIYTIEIYGHKQIKKWMKLISFSNQRHLRKVPLVN